MKIVEFTSVTINTDLKSNQLYIAITSTTTRSTVTTTTVALPIWTIKAVRTTSPAPVMVPIFESEMILFNKLILLIVIYFLVDQFPH